jgi:hypothetical protein
MKTLFLLALFSYCVINADLIVNAYKAFQYKQEKKKACVERGYTFDWDKSICSDGCNKISCQ